MSPILSILPKKAVDPATFTNMSAAFADACRALGVPDQNDPLAEEIAKHIIAASERGIRTKAGLYFGAVMKFKAHCRVQERNQRSAR